MIRYYHFDQRRVPTKRNPYEQQEYQRENPQMFTTPTQSVNADGSLITYEQVTTSLQQHYDKLVKNAEEYAIVHKFNPEFWYLMDGLAPVKQMTDYLVTQMKLCQRDFVENYKHLQERLR
jgi:hypothetical protein